MSALEYLPPELIEAILPFLPPKSLGRFKSVSKSWCSLISSLNFIKTHIHHYTKNNPNPNPTHLIQINDCRYPYSLDMKQLNTQTTPATLTAKPLNFQEPWVQILGSCNGLLLADDMYHNLFLINPTTAKPLKVPHSPVALAQGEGDYTYGFGYDSSTDDYKIISISNTDVSDSDPGCIFVCVYSLRNNSWNKLPKSHYGDVSLRHGVLTNDNPGVLINNNLHWLVRSRRSTTIIAAFSLADEGFHEIELPDSVNSDRALCSQLAALGGKLVVIYDVFYIPELADIHESVNELWVMEKYGVPKSWTKVCLLKHDVNLYVELFAQVSNRDILWGGSSDANEIYIYNMDERKCTSVTIEGCKEGFMVYGTYVESLESLERFH